MSLICLRGFVPSLPPPTLLCKRPVLLLVVALGFLYTVQWMRLPHTGKEVTGPQGRMLSKWQKRVGHGVGPLEGLS